MGTTFESSNFDSAQQSQSSFGSTLDSSSFDFGSTSTLGLPLSSSRAPPTNFANLGSSGAGFSSGGAEFSSGGSGFSSGGAEFSSGGSGFGGSGFSSSFDSSS